MRDFGAVSFKRSERSDVDLAAGVIRVERGWDEKAGAMGLKTKRDAAGCRSRPCCATTWPNA